MPLVVHYWVDLQSVHGLRNLRCYGNRTRTRNASEHMLVLANISCSRYVRSMPSFSVLHCVPREVNSSEAHARSSQVILRRTKGLPIVLRC